MVPSESCIKLKSTNVFELGGKDLLSWDGTLMGPLGGTEVLGEKCEKYLLIWRE
jgi:hypothetical protein